jgi:hypothetical protein
MASTMQFSKRRNSVMMERSVLTKRQDSLFAQPQAAREGNVQGCTLLTNMQDSIFALLKVARQGNVQGCTL